MRRLDIAELLRKGAALSPRMAGASARERAIAVLGALLGIAITGLISGLATGQAAGLPLLIAPMGATAVLLFAVPSSPLAQPWSIVGGNTLSALTAIAIGHLVPQPALAAAAAVAAAIAVMSLARCLHPPGGAAALLVALLGPSSAAGSFMFALVPVALNSAVIVAIGYAFHRFSGHVYPHLPKPAPASPHGTRDAPPQLRQGLSDADIDAAIAESGEAFDIGRDDLAVLIRRAERAAIARTRQVPRCGEVMSKDVLTVPAAASLATARALLLERNLRTLPVVDAAGHVAGIVGLRNLLGAAAEVGEVMLRPTIAATGDSVLGLIDPLTDGRTHAVIITDDAQRLAGMITQTDLIALLARLAVSGVVGEERAPA